MSVIENAFILNGHCQDRLLIGIAHGFTLTGHIFPAQDR